MNKIDKAFKKIFMNKKSLMVTCQCGNFHITNDTFNNSFNQNYELFHSVTGKIIHHDEYMIYWGHISGMGVFNGNFIEGCPCKTDHKIKQFLQSNKKDIISFYKEAEWKTGSAQVTTHNFIKMRNHK